MALRRIWKLVFFPNTTNQLFDFPTDAQYLSLDVEVRESQQGPTPAIVPTKLAFILSPEARQLQPATSSRRITAGEQSINVKIIQANFSHQSNGRPEFTPTVQVFVDVTENTANVNYILSVIQKKWGMIWFW